MKKIGIITFHAAHNYGSSLQAYALQKTIADLGYYCEIINFRTEAQKDQYTPLTKRKGIKYAVKNAYFLLNYSWRKAKYDKFEEFIDTKLIKSPQEYSSLQQLYNSQLPYTHYISGSDQIWNTVPNDANMAYFLPFVTNAKRIAFAPSFGQVGNIKRKDEIKDYLNDYDYISVRDNFGKDLVKELTGRDVPVLVDPTMLFTKEKWLDFTDKKALVDGDYIFFYTLFADKAMIKFVKNISDILNMPVVISNISNQYEIFSGFKKYTKSGPLEFLNLINNAKFVCSSSFHGTVFSILLHKPFIAINGEQDKRISTLLETTNLQNCSVDVCDKISKKNIEELLKLNFSGLDTKIDEERKKALEFIEQSLN